MAEDEACDGPAFSGESRLLGGIVVSLRPKQWIKNLVVFAGIIFSRNLFDPALELKTWVAFVTFCAVVSSGYLLNDILDRQEDQKHPLKAKRPIASGAVTPAQAITVGVFLTTIAFLVAYFVEPLLLLFLGGYVVLQFAYTLILKQMVIIDLLAIAAGFVLRAIAGAAILFVEISPWLIICALLLALFLGLAKRRAELVLLEQDAPVHRPTLDHYSLDLVDQMTGVTASAVLVSYSLYSFTTMDPPWMMLTIPFVLYGIFRYLYLIHLQLRGGSPEQVLLTDRPLLINVVCWALTAVAILKLTA